MGAQKQKTSSTQNVSMGPWGPAQDAIKGAIPEIQGQYQNDQNNTLVPQAQGYLSQAIGGNFLDPSTNPHLGALTKSITDPVQARLSAQFGAAGRGNSGDAARYISEGMTSGLAAPLFSQYNTERGLQQNAAQMAPAMQAADSLPLDQMIQRLTQIGGLGRQGTTTTEGTTTTTPSIGQTISGAALTGLGLMQGMPKFGLSAGAPSMFGGMQTPAGWW